MARSEIERIVTAKKPKKISDSQLREFIMELEGYEHTFKVLMGNKAQEAESNRILEQKIEDLLSLSVQLRRLLQGLEFLDWFSPEGERRNSPSGLTDRINFAHQELESVISGLPTRRRRGRPRNFRAELVASVLNKAFREAGIKPTQTKSGLYAQVLDHFYSLLEIEADTQYKAESVKNSR